jgi:hypothetical protein
MTDFYSSNFSLYGIKSSSGKQFIETIYSFFSCAKFLSRTTSCRVDVYRVDSAIEWKRDGREEERARERERESEKEWERGGGNEVDCMYAAYTRMDERATVAIISFSDLPSILSAFPSSFIVPSLYISVPIYKRWTYAYLYSRSSGFSLSLFLFVPLDSVSLSPRSFALSDLLFTLQ